LSIDKVILPQDLLSIGITSLGPRKKIVNALSGVRDPFASSAEVQAQSHCTSGHVTERQRDKSTTRKASEPKKPTANKLITEFFPGQATEGTKIRTAPKPVAEKSPSDSSSRRAVRRNGNNGKSKVIPHWNCIPGTPFRVVMLHNKLGHGLTSPHECNNLITYASFSFKSNMLMKLDLKRHADAEYLSFK